MYYTYNQLIIYQAKRRYAFRSYLCNYFYYSYYFFNKANHKKKKKIVKVVEDDIYGKLSKIYKETEKGRVS